MPFNDDMPNPFKEAHANLYDYSVLEFDDAIETWMNGDPTSVYMLSPQGDTIHVQGLDGNVVGHYSLDLTTVLGDDADRTLHMLRPYITAMTKLDLAEHGRAYITDHGEIVCPYFFATADAMRFAWEFADDQWTDNLQNWCLEGAIPEEHTEKAMELYEAQKAASESVRTKEIEARRALLTSVEHGGHRKLGAQLRGSVDLAPEVQQLVQAMVVALRWEDREQMLAA